MYRAAEKRWRQSDGLEAELIDVEREAGDERVLRVPVSDDAPGWLRGARVFRLGGVDGFWLLRNPFSPEEELRWCAAALCAWAEAPNESNLLATHGPLRDVFADHVAASVAGGSGGRAAASTSASGSGSHGSLLSRLSWVTFGYHYQWTSRTYDARRRSPFPPDLAALSEDLAATVGARIRPEAAIVNYYSAKSTMGGHRDDAEPFQVSSFGLESVLLCSSPTRRWVYDPAVP